MEDSIAVIGMSGRFPGARSVEALWRNLQEGVESITRFSEAELREAGFEASLLADPAYVPARAALDEVERFDAPFFGYHPREASLIDPQHRLFLTCSHEALEDAGYDPRRYGGAIGVYAGCGLNTYLLDNLCRDRAFIEALTGGYQVSGYDVVAGNEKDYLVTRVSHRLDLRGPSVLVQSACSTSLVAVAQACQALLSWQCDIALAGGASVSVPQRRGYLYEEGGIASRDGHCRPFDAHSSGTVFGAGVGVVVLKRLSDALSEGDNVVAVIRGFAVNNDGADKLSFMAPSVQGQAEVITLAQAVGDVDPATIGYVEAHGTGTPIGDPIEVAALTQAFRAGTERRGFCALGSVKGNVGHLEVAAGVTGLIKVVLMLRDRKLVPTLHFGAPNPRIDFASSPFYVNTELRAWPAGETPRRAGVTALGVGGTNAHVVLEEAPEVAAAPPPRPLHLLVLSARTPTALDAAAARLADHLEAHPGLPLADAAHTLQTGRRVLSQRRAVVCADAADAIARLRERARALEGDADPPIAFMFPGQGAQHAGMGRPLYESERVFREAVDGCCEILRPLLDVDLRTLLYPDATDTEAADARLRETSLTQPALFTTEYALARLWMSWGVRPQAMIGHSVGEYVAACVAEVFTLEDALALLAARARLMHALPVGSMLAVRATEQEMRPHLNGTLSVAAVNGPKACVISGPTPSVAALEAALNEGGTPCRRLQTSHAFHSAMMDPLEVPFTALAATIRRAPPVIPYVSNVTATWITAADLDDPTYWFRHLRGAVRFAEGLGALLADPRRVLLEVGPGQALSALARPQVRFAKTQHVVASLPPAADAGADLASVLGAAGKLWSVGAALDWAAFNGPGRRRVSLPTYPFEEQRCWVEAPARGHAVETSAPPVATMAPEASAEPSGDAPHSPLVRELQATLGELAGVDGGAIDPGAVLLEAGFDSLFLTQAAQAFRTRFGVRISLRDLLGDVCTLEAVAARIAAQRGRSEPPSAERWSALVDLQEAAAPALFFVHSLGGDSGGGFSYYRALARRLAPAFGSVGIRAPEVPFDDIEVMAARYIDEMRKRQPRGPYHLAGYCFGGLVAYEMARQLLEAGHEVPLLVLFETSPPGFVSLGERLRRGTRLFSLKTVRGVLRRLSPWRRRELRLEEVVDLSRYPPDYVEAARVHWQASVRYKPRPCAARVLVVRCRAPLGGATGWERLAQGGVRVVDVPSLHGTIMEHTEIIAQAIEAAAPAVQPVAAT